MKLPVLTMDGNTVEAYGYKHCYYETPDYCFRNKLDFYICLANGTAVAFSSSVKPAFTEWEALRRTLISPQLELSNLPITARAVLKPGQELVNNITSLSSIPNINYAIGTEQRLISGGIALTSLNRALAYGRTMIPKVIQNAKQVFILENSFFALTTDGTLHQIGYEYIHDYSPCSSIDASEVKKCLESWIDIVKVAICGYTCFGLHKDGRISVCNGPRQDFSFVKEWGDVVDIMCTTDDIYALHKDQSLSSSSADVHLNPFAIHRKDQASQYDRVLDSSIHFEQMDHVKPALGASIAWNENGILKIALLETANVVSINTTLHIEDVFQSDLYSDMFYIVAVDGATYELFANKSQLREAHQLTNAVLSKKQYVLQENGQCWERRYSSEKGAYYILVDENVIDMGYGDDYFFKHYRDHHVSVVANRNASKYPSHQLEAILAVYPTATHVIFLHDDKSVSFMGNNTNRCCNKLSQYRNVVKVEAKDDLTVLTMQDASSIYIPSSKSRR